MKPVDKRKHHYVPQFLLRNFASEKRETLYAFDKWNDRQFQVAVKDAAAEHCYNSFETDQASGCAEDYFSEIENEASPFIQQIISDRQLRSLAPDGQTAVARLAIAQMLRSKNHRAVFDQIGRMFRKLAERECSPEFQAWVGPANPAADKQALLADLERDVQHYLPYLLHKNLVLFRSTEDCPLLIGDSPLVTTNTLNVSEFGGTTGLASRGVEIYLPLSPTLALAFMCPTIGEMMRVVVNTFGESVNETASSYVAALESHQSLALARPNVDFLNSHQVIAAERFVYSGFNDFALVWEMLRSDSTLRKGKRMTTNHGTFEEE